MSKPRATPLPAELARSTLRTLRPKDVSHVYAHPRPELSRLADRGVLHRVAHGYFVVVPQDQVGRSWRPELEAAAAGIATSVYGADRVALMGVSAARVFGAIPRALAMAVVAVPNQHRPIEFVDRRATVLFTKRNTNLIDVERVETSLGPALVTTPEQTLLDLARWPLLGNAEIDIPSAIGNLFHRSDSGRLEQLAHEQRRMATLQRAKAWAGVTN